MIKTDLNISNEYKTKIKNKPMFLRVNNEKIKR